MLHFNLNGVYIIKDSSEQEKFEMSDNNFNEHKTVLPYFETSEILTVFIIEI